MSEVDHAVAGARQAFDSWSATALDERIAVLNSFAEQLRAQRDELREIICRETGKPRWDSGGEVDAMIGKVAISIDAQRQRRGDTSSEAGVVRYKPHGVVAVLGPFNFPGHLPNGHIVPALLAGNAVVFKPSELTPATADKTAELWQAAGLPKGVLNIVHGGREVGEAVVRHPGVDGVFFTGSFAVGRAINRLLADHPGKIAALEMGGNNPLVVHNIVDTSAAAYLTIQSAFISSGQRCSCARRLIVTRNNESYIDALVSMTRRLRVGHYIDEPEPFMGPVINAAAAQKLLIAQVDLLNRGGEALLEMRAIADDPALLSPGIIDVTGVVNRRDEELFGPLLQLIRVRDLDEAIVEANRTQYGLTAGILTDDVRAYERFFRRVRAGVVNWNRALTGASSKLPFGGTGNSGNHRPSAAFAADYCSYPVASMESETPAVPAKLLPGIEL
jgi:succinylglutamic semialdehyde dehydrogenase